MGGNQGEVRERREAPFWQWAMLIGGAVNLLAAGVVMNRLGSRLRSLRPDGEPGAGLGQLPWTDGIGHGRDAAVDTINRWIAYAVDHPGDTTGQTLATRWLVIDTAVFALLGYVTVAVATVLIARGARRAETGVVRTMATAFMAAGGLGVAIGAVDVVENVLAWRVVAADGGGPVDVLRAVTVVKWVLVAVLAICIATGAWLWLTAVRGRRRRREPMIAASRASVDRLRAWAASLGWSFGWLVASVLILAAMAGRRWPLWAVGGAVLLFIFGSYRFNATLEQRRQSDRRDRHSVVGTRLIAATTSLIAGGTVALGHQWTGGNNGVGFIGLVLALFGASGLLGELRWSRRGRPLLSIVVLLAGAALAVIGLWFATPVLGIVLLGVAIFVAGVTGLSIGAEDVLRWLSEPPAGNRSATAWQRHAVWVLVVAGTTTVAGVLVWASAAGWSGRQVTALIVVSVLLAVAVGSNWAAEVAIAAGGVALVWALLPSSVPPDDGLGNVADDDRLMVLVGDSYASGEGADTYYEGTNTSEPSARNKCRRSPTAYGPLLVSEGRVPIDRIAFLACSGAKVDHVSHAPQYSGEPVGGAAPGIPQLAQAVAIRAPLGDDDMVIAGIGGNDAGFGDVVGNCVAPGDCATIAYRWRDGLADLGPELESLYALLREELGPAPRYLAMPYPIPIGDRSCDDSSFTDSEHRFLAAFTAEMNRVVRAAAGRQGFEYVEAVEGALRGSGAGLCMGGPRLGVNYLVLGQEAGALEEQANVRNWLHNSMHPNPYGHRLVADALEGWIASTPKPATVPVTTEPSPEPYEVASAAALAGPGVTICDGLGGGPDHCRHTGAAWPAAQTLASARAHVWIILAAFAGVASALLGILLLWRQRLLLDGYDWVRRGGGRLERHERLALAVPLLTGLVAFAFDFVMRPLRALLRRVRPGSERSLSEPDEVAEAAVRELYDQLAEAGADPEEWVRAVEGHSWRAYQFGMALADRDAVALDRTVFYVAAMGHDLGLLRAPELAGANADPDPDSDSDPDPDSDPEAEPACFTAASAAKVEAVLDAAGLATGTVDVQDGIVNHVTPSLTLTHDHPMGIYLQRGSLLDLTGQRSSLLPPGFHELVWSGSPPGSGQPSGEVLAELWEREQEAVPAGRARYINCCGGLLTRLMRKAPHRPGGDPPAGDPEVARERSETTTGA